MYILCRSHHHSILDTHYPWPNWLTEILFPSSNFLEVDHTLYISGASRTLFPFLGYTKEDKFVSQREILFIMLCLKLKSIGNDFS